MLRSKSNGGIEPRLDREATALAQAGHDVTTILWDRARQHQLRERRNGYTIERVHLLAPYNKLATMQVMPTFWWEAKHILMTLRPDVVHACDYDTMRVALWAKKVLGCKVVFDIWDFYGLMMTRRIGPLRLMLSALERRAAAQADLIVLPHENRVRDWMRNVTVVHNSPADGVFNTEKMDDRLTVCYVGVISRDRGLIPLAEACKTIGARLIIAGDGPDSATMFPLLDRTGAIVLGYMHHSEAMDLEAASDVIAALYDPRIPNNRFPAPAKMYEAMMLGKPLLTNYGTSLAEFVESENIGYVVKSLSASDIAVALALADVVPISRKAKGERGRQYYERCYRWEDQAKRLIRAYETLV